MTDRSLHESKSYGAIRIGGSAAALLGDHNDHSVKYSIQHANFNFFDDNTHVRIPFQALTNRSHLENDARSGEGLALLSFDGGLDGGFSSLYMLNHFMERVGQAQGLKHTPKPCEFFNIVGGAGLLAILLGCLELSIDECIDKYLYLNQAIFENELVDTTQRSTSENTEGKPKPKPMIIEATIKKVLKDCGQDGDKHLEASRAISCKVFVKAATSKANITFRSYKLHEIDSSKLSHLEIWQAVQATLTAAGLLDAVKIGDGQPEDTYGPSTAFELSTISDLWAEAQRILIDGDQKLEDHLDCLVSVGPNFTKPEDGKGMGLRTLRLASRLSLEQPTTISAEAIGDSFRRTKFVDWSCRLSLMHLQGGNMRTICTFGLLSSSILPRRASRITS
ncbi:hypothetical protein H2198_006028 [Neophaeococcomyces mojaviensis]|uniref:Uncharacterized protein n=1 Tax=Neophaeococcomyces mojaviensis TaxID=3383035 RepID=A0ACC3A432_9EURO|nr:hypothetical protein H2198_006028 [Knufia sp. JES_112]